MLEARNFIRLLGRANECIMYMKNIAWKNRLKSTLAQAAAPYVVARVATPSVNPIGNLSANSRDYQSGQPEW